MKIITILILSYLVLIQGIVEAQLIKINTIPLWDHEEIHGISFIDSSLGWVISNARNFKTTDGGNTWETLSRSSYSHHYQSYLKFTSELNGYIVNNGTLYRTIDGGSTWQSIFGSGSDIYFLDQNISWIATDGPIFKTLDGWSTWVEISRPNFFDPKISFNDENNGILISSTNIYYTEDSGVSWIQSIIQNPSALSYDRLVDVEFVANNVSYAISEKGKLLKSLDGGKNWGHIQLPYPYDTHVLRKWKMKFLNESIGYLTTTIFKDNKDFYYSVVLRTMDGGITWDRYPLCNTYGELEIEFFSPDNNINNHWVLLGGKGTLIKTKLTDSIQKYVKIKTPIGSNEFIENESINLSWDYNNVTNAQSLVIEFFKLDFNEYDKIDATQVYTDTVNVADGEVNILVPRVCENTVSTKGYIRIYSPDNINYEDVSETFSLNVEPRLEINIPNFNNQLFVGNEINLSLTSYAVESYRLQYSTDNGLAWENISETIEAGTNIIKHDSFKWTVPDKPSKHCRLRIVSEGGDHIAVLNNVFEITNSNRIFTFPLDVGNIWNYSDYQHEGYYLTLEAVSDTIINNNTYTKILFSGSYYDALIHIFYRNPMYLRQDGNILYEYITADSIKTVYNFANSNYITMEQYGRDLKTFSSYFPENNYGSFTLVDSIGYTNILTWNSRMGFYHYRLNTFKLNNVWYGLPTYIENPVRSVPVKFSLNQNYPNPFNPSTTIRFSLPEATNVKLNIYNVLGEKLYSLIDNHYSVGTHEVEFMANDLPSGVYYYSLQSHNYFEYKKMLLLK